MDSSPPSVADGARPDETGSATANATARCGPARPCSAADSIATALSPSEGPKDGLAREIERDALPEAVRTTLERYEADLLDTDEFSHASASVLGIYAIYTSKDALEPVGYGLWGRVQFEPDGEKRWAFGFDPNGEAVYEEEFDFG